MPARPCCDRRRPHHHRQSGTSSNSRQSPAGNTADRAASRRMSTDLVSTRRGPAEARYAGPREVAELTRRPRRLLERRMNDTNRPTVDFAGRWWRTAGAAEDTIRVEFGISATRFWRRVISAPRRSRRCCVHARARQSAATHPRRPVTTPQHRRLVGRPPLSLGTFGKITHYEVSPGVWRARAKYRDYDDETRRAA